MKSYINVLNKNNRVLIDIIDFKLVCSDYLERTKEEVPLKKVLLLINLLNESIRVNNEEDYVENEFITVTLDSNKLDDLMQNKNRKEE